VEARIEVSTRLKETVETVSTDVGHDKLVIGADVGRERSYILIPAL